MSKKRNGVSWSKSPNAKHRRKNALDRLEAQLKLGHKAIKVPGKKDAGSVALTDKDKARITKELEILKTRV